MVQTAVKKRDSENRSVLFMGTPDFAAASLEALVNAEYDVCGVVTQPDKPKNRGMSTAFSAVKECALKHQLPVYQPLTLKDESFYALLKLLHPAIIVVVAYGKLLPEPVLQYPKYGCINIHGSLLPAYRGAAPIQRSVLNGDAKTGVTSMFMSSSLDAGDIIFKEETEIGLYETSGELFQRLQLLGADLLIKTVDAVFSGCAPRTTQNSDEVTYAPPLDKSLCPIDWNRSSLEIIKQIYGLQPWPVATTVIHGETLKVFSAVLTGNKTKKTPGSILNAGKDGIEIACGNGDTIRITEVQISGKRRMDAADYLRGHPVKCDYE